MSSTSTVKATPGTPFTLARPRNVADVEAEVRAPARVRPAEDLELRHRRAAAAVRAAVRARRRADALEVVAVGERVDVEAARHVAGVDEALVLLGRPRVGARHHVPAARVAPVGLRVLGDPVGGGRRGAEVDVPDAGAVVRAARLGGGQTGDAVEAGRDLARAGGAV